MRLERLYISHDSGTPLCSGIFFDTWLVFHGFMVGSSLVLVLVVPESLPSFSCLVFLSL